MNVAQHPFRFLSLGMVGHSKWSKVKYIKGPLDVRRGAASTRMVKQITVAMCLGESDLSGNPRLHFVVETARAANMLEDNTERTIEKGTARIAGEHHEKVFGEALDGCGATQNVYSISDLSEALPARLAA